MSAFRKSRALQPQAHAIGFFGYAIGIGVKHSLGGLGKPTALRTGGDAQDFAWSETFQSHRRYFLQAIRIVRASGRTGTLACSLLSCFEWITNFQDVAFAQRAAFMAPEPAEEVRRSAAEERFHFDSAANTQIAARARTGRTKPKCLARPHFEGNPGRNSSAVKRRAEVGTRHRCNACSLELKRSA